VYSNSINGYNGFPLDDAWIHQTYARNLAETGQWAYLPGEVSGGSTSPLWTLLLAFLRWMGIGAFPAAWVLGGVFLCATAYMGELWYSNDPQSKPRLPVYGLLIALEWHFVWAALSGMETMIFIFVILLVFMQLQNIQRYAYIIGFLIGLSVWIRPDGLTLLGPAIFVALLEPTNRKQKPVRLLQIISGFLSMVIPYLMFNRIIAGQWLPNTFFAKQAEYASMTQLPVLLRIGTLYMQPLIGVGIILVPGFIFHVKEAIKGKNFWVIAAVLWCLGYIFMFVLRLPVSYQHGRYLIPVMPVYILLALRGSLAMFARRNVDQPLHRILGLTGVISAILVTGVFWIKGMDAYRQDTAIIHEEMVIPSMWIRDHLPDDAIIAAHDIGALGYYGKTRIVDLAGLITPDVISIIRDEDALLMFMENSRADHLMTFPDWYGLLPQYGEIVYESEGKTSQMLGATNMTIYRLEYP
jgi:hypothetical protein